MAKILALGSALQDIFLIDRDDFVGVPIGPTCIFGKVEIGSKVDVDKVSFEVGGGGTNAAVTFARYGHDSIFLGNIGNDPAGEAILATLDQEGVDSSLVSTVRKTTGCSVILLDAKTGERTILTHRGASAKFDNLDPNVLKDLQPDWLYITSVRGGMETLLKFIEVAKENQIKIMFNPGMLELTQPEKLLGILAEVDILLLNKKEASALVPGTVLAELAARLQNYTETVIVTDGTMGGIALGKDEGYRFGIYEDVRVKDTTGAGDAFGAGFLAALTKGKSFKSSLIFAAANSTSVITKIGAKKGILTGKEKLHQMPIQKVKC